MQVYLSPKESLSHTCKTPQMAGRHTLSIYYVHQPCRCCSEGFISAPEEVICDENQHTDKRKTTARNRWQTVVLHILSSAFAAVTGCQQDSQWEWSQFPFLLHGSSINRART